MCYHSYFGQKNPILLLILEPILLTLFRIKFTHTYFESQTSSILYSIIIHGIETV